MALRIDGDTAKPWTGIVERYASMAAAHDEFRDIAALVHKLAASPFPTAGLCAVTSMHDLILGPSSQVLANPYLLVRPDFKGSFTFAYEDGSPRPWTRTVPASESYEALVRFLTKRARWYTHSV